METNIATAQASTGKDVYTIVTDKIIDQLNKGTVPWRQPWTDAGVPRNLISKKPYRGLNVMLLASLGYEHNLFLTFKQLKEIGGAPKKDEKAHLVIFWNYGKDDKDTESEEENKSRKKPILRYYLVYNIAQCTGISEELIPHVEKKEIVPIKACQEIVLNMPHCPPIKNKEHKAYYDPLRDFVNMPKPAAFESSEAYYSVLWHELIHSTGHFSRLNRETIIGMSEFGSDAYSQEELVAEIGACYLQSYVGITEQFEQSAAYIQGWLQKLKSDKRFIFSASSQAQKAVDYILNVQSEPEEKQPIEE